MLKMEENIVDMKVFGDVWGDNVFHDFTKNTCQWDETIVSGVTLIAFLKEGGDVRLDPVGGDSACVYGFLKDSGNQGVNLYT